MRSCLLLLCLACACRQREDTRPPPTPDAAAAPPPTPRWAQLRALAYADRERARAELDELSPAVGSPASSGSMASYGCGSASDDRRADFRDVVRTLLARRHGERLARGKDAEGHDLSAIEVDLGCIDPGYFVIGRVRWRATAAGAEASEGGIVHKAVLRPGNDDDPGVLAEVSGPWGEAKAFSVDGFNLTLDEDDMMESPAVLLSKTLADGAGTQTRFWVAGRSAASDQFVARWRGRPRGNEPSLHADAQLEWRLTLVGKKLMIRVLGYPSEPSRRPVAADRYARFDHRGDVLTWDPAEAVELVGKSRPLAERLAASETFEALAKAEDNSSAGRKALHDALQQLGHAVPPELEAD